MTSALIATSVLDKCRVWTFLDRFSADLYCVCSNPVQNVEKMGEAKSSLSLFPFSILDLLTYYITDIVGGGCCCRFLFNFDMVKIRYQNVDDAVMSVIPEPESPRLQWKWNCGQVLQLLVLGIPSKFRHT